MSTINSINSDEGKKKGVQDLIKDSAEKTNDNLEEAFRKDREERQKRAQELYFANKILQRV